MQRIEERETLVSVDEWASSVETRWRNIPEYRVDPERLSHLAIICDGNRRSACEKGFNEWQGHRVGVEVIKGIMRASRNWGVRHLTFWTWSTENWKRDQAQVGFVMNLASTYLRDEDVVRELMDNNARFTHLGRKDRLPREVVEAICDLEEETLSNDYYRVNLALDYGGLDEIARGMIRVSESIQAGDLTSKDIYQNPDVICQFLDMKDQPHPDLVIRTGTKEGEISHTSGFMPIQTAYSGWLFLPDLFPDLHPEVLCGSIRQFEEYERRFGQ